MMPDPLALRSRLLALRADTLRQLGEADRIEPGYLTVLAGAEAALRMLDAEAVEMPTDAVPAERVVLDDVPSEPIALTTLHNPALPSISLSGYTRVAGARGLIGGV